MREQGKDTSSHRMSDTENNFAQYIANWQHIIKLLTSNCKRTLLVMLLPEEKLKSWTTSRQEKFSLWVHWRSSTKSYYNVNISAMCHDSMAC